MTPAKGHLEPSVVNEVGSLVLKARRPHRREPGVSQAELSEGLAVGFGLPFGIRGEESVKDGSPLELSEQSEYIHL